jgi:hypothetical protein
LGEPNEKIPPSFGNNDIFIARYNPDGTLAWVKSAGGVDKDDGNAIASLSGNSTVVTGGFKSDAIFGYDEPNETTLTCAGGWDNYIAQYNSDGALAWAKSTEEGTNDDYGYGITTLPDNSAIVSGFFYDSVIFGKGDPKETNLFSAGQSDIFIARYNPDGTLAWANSAGGLDSDTGYGITALSDNSIVMTGWFGYPYGSSATFGLGEPNETPIPSAGNADIFVARFEP